MDSDLEYTKVDILNSMILTKIQQVLSNILHEYEKTGILDKAIGNELIRIDWTIHKLNGKKARKLKGVMKTIK